MSKAGSHLPDEMDSVNQALTRTEFAELVRDAHSRVWLLAAGMTGNSATADDIVQDTTLIAWRKRAEFQPGTNFSAWLAEMVRRCALNYRRKERSRNTVATDPHSMDQVADDESGMGFGNPPSVGTGGEVNEYQLDFDDELLHALRSLKAEARCCLLLQVVQGMSYAEIADLLNIPQGTAMSHVHRSRQSLRQWLSDRQSGANKHPN